METPSTLNGNGEVWSSRCSPWLARTIPFSTRHAKNPDWFAMGSSFFSPPASTLVNSSSRTAVPPPIGPDNGNPPRAVAKPLPFAALPSSSSSSSSPSPPTPTAKWSMRTALYKSTPFFSSCSTQSSKTQCPTSSSSSQTEPSPERKPCWPAPSSLVRNFFFAFSCSAANSLAEKLRPTYRPCSAVIRIITPYCPPGSSSVNPRPFHHPTKPAPLSLKEAALL
mmetsp:Transcript_9804/g.36408  ORF Transcript_9804/g.36408 Transcript_9804/m.36408 type:complete len:223 (+) Transcript_9804:2707-3375(+)